MGNCLSICCCSVKAAVFPELEIQTMNNITTSYNDVNEVEVTSVKIIEKK
jgi:hypothetical protein